MLADLMLPDQMHNRSQDWTIFFLHKETTIEDERDLRNGRHGVRTHGGDMDMSSNGDFQDAVVSDDVERDPDDERNFGGEHHEIHDDNDVEEQPLIYVLNLVNTKYDSAAQRYVS